MNDLDARLRAAAQPTEQGRVHGAPARELLERIVTSPRTERAPVTVPARRTGLRWAAAGAAAVAVTGATLALPGRDAAAYASWTATPARLSAADTGAIGSDCVRAVQPDYQVGATREVVAERRGDYRYVAVITDALIVTCFRDGDGEVRNSSVMADPVGAAALGRSGVELQGYGQLRAGEGYVRIMSGHVGAEVTAVDDEVPGGPTVHATLDDHHFLAWYPEEVGAGAGTTLTLTLADGSRQAGLSARDLHDAPKLD